MARPGPETEAGLAKFVFSCLVDRAFSQATRPRPERVEQWRQAVEIGDEGEAQGTALVQSLVGDAPSPRIPSLFSSGYHSRARRFSGEQRKAYHATMAPVIRWLEEHTPHTLWPQCEADAPQAERAWLRHVAAVDLARQGDGLWPEDRVPWLLCALVRGSSTTALANLPGPEIAARIARLLSAPEHRPHVVRRLAADARDPRILRSLCASPAFFEEDELCLKLLTEGDSDQISCALHALRLTPGMAPTVAAGLTRELGSRPFAEIAARVVEIRGQAGLAPALHPELGEAVRDLVVKAAESGALGRDGKVLLAAVSRDARLFRHVMLPAEVADAIEPTIPELAEALRVGVMEAWASSFTPAGVSHPLHDEMFCATIGAVVAARVARDEASAADVAAIGAQLSKLARRFAPRNQAPVEGRFHAAFIRSVLAAARQAWSEQPDGEAAILLYGVVAHHAAGPAHRLLGSGLLGALDHRIEPGNPQALTRKVVTDVARMEAGGVFQLGMTRHSSPSLRAIPVAASTTSRIQIADAVAVGGDDTEEDATAPAPAEVGVLRATAWPARDKASLWRLLPALFLGIEPLSRLFRLAAGLFGYAHTGELEHDGDRIVYRDTVRVGRRKLREREQEAAVSLLGEVTARYAPSAAYRLFGWGVLVSAWYLAVRMVFDGLRSASAGHAAAGLALGMVGLLFDGACQRASAEGRQRSIVTATRPDGSVAFRCQVARDEAEALMARLTPPDESPSEEDRPN